MCGQMGIWHNWLGSKATEEMPQGYFVSLYTLIELTHLSNPFSGFNLGSTSAVS